MVHRAKQWFYYSIYFYELQLEAYYGHKHNSLDKKHTNTTWETRG